jgi:hypothetical protein
MSERKKKVRKVLPTAANWWKIRRALWVYCIRILQCEFGKGPLVTIFVAISHLQRIFQKFDICLLPSKDRVKLQAGYEGRKERGRWEGREFYSGG